MVPQTPFEQSGVWTSLSEESAFLAAVQSVSNGHMMYTQESSSYQGRALYVAHLGGTSSLTNPMASILITGNQHGNEYAGREAALKLIRDLATSTDPNILAYLDAHSVIVVPTTNPDGFTAAQRNSAQNINLNRDHIRLQTPEIKLVQTLMRDWRPNIYIDLHEQWSASGVNLRTAWPKNPNVDTQLADYTKALLDTAVSEALNAAGMTYGYYTFSDAGADYWENISHNMAGLRHSIGMLFESYANQSASTRVNAHYTAIRSVIEKHRVSATEIATIVTGSRSRKIAEGTAQSRAFDLRDGLFISPPPIGYTFTGAQQVAAANYFSIFDVTIADGYVSMAQAAQPVIPLLFDNSAPMDVVAGTRVYGVPDPEPDPEPTVPLQSGRPIAYKVRIHGITYEATMVKCRLNGVTRTIWPG